jgi:hypothetical protein
MAIFLLGFLQPRHSCKDYRPFPASAVASLTYQDLELTEKPPKPSAFPIFSRLRLHHGTTLARTLSMVTRTPFQPAQAAPALRLVNAGVAFPQLRSRPSDASELVPPSQLPTRRRHVARENVSASKLKGTDARWVFAVLVSKSLEGGRAAILSPEKRERLVASAVSMGLRPFDAHLVIAIVQDCARCGHDRMCEETESRLSLIRPPEEVTSTQDGAWGVHGWLAAGSIALGLGLALWLILGVR